MEKTKKKEKKYRKNYVDTILYAVCVKHYKKKNEQHKKSRKESQQYK